MNIIRYVKKNKASFDEIPFDEADSLVLCQLSYLCFTRTFAGKPAKTLQQLAEMPDITKDTLLPESNVKLLKAVGTSPRFSKIKLGLFRERNSVKRETRFAAVTFQIGRDLHYVAYRGTDITLIGWKEDFNMATLDAIPSQKLAANYLDTVAAAVNGDLILGGHSKGGNLAVYAGFFADEQTKKRIVAIYDHDGPGFREDIFDDTRYVQIASRIRKTVPHDSIIGMLLNVSEHYEVVESRAVSIMQHNPFAWEIGENCRFKKLPETTRNSVTTNMAMTNWIAGMDDATKKKFVTAMFAVILGSGAQTVPELLSRPLSKIKKMKKAFETLDEESKKLLSGNGKELITLWFASFKLVHKQKK